MRLVKNKLGEGAKRIKYLHVTRRKLKDTRLKQRDSLNHSKKLYCIQKKTTERDTNFDKHIDTIK